MIGEPENSICPVCGGTLQRGLATIPFIFENTIVIVKEVPAEICADCRESFMAGNVTDQVVDLLNKLKALPSEVSVVNFHEMASV